MITIALVNQSTIVSNQDIVECLSVLQARIVEEFYPTYGISALLGFWPEEDKIPNDFWRIPITDGFVKDRLASRISIEILKLFREKIVNGIQNLAQIV